MKPPFPSREDFIVASIALSKAKTDTPEYKEHFWSHMYWTDLIDDHPDEAFSIILEICARDRSNEVKQDLSAGALENLLVAHGERMMARIEAEAAQNPGFRKLLGGVWQNAMPDPIWARVQAIWDRRGWDGIPEEGS